MSDSTDAETATRVSPRVRRLTHPFGRPVHPLIASVAVGAWFCSLGFDVVSRLSDTEFVYARGAYVLTAIGVLAAVVASLTGLMDLTEVERDSPAWTIGIRHLLAMDAAIVLFTVSFLIRRSSDFAFHDPPTTAASLMSALGLVALSVGLWHGARVVDALPPRSDAEPAHAA